MSDGRDGADALVIPDSALIPGGVLESDHAHVGSSDETCSRCRRPIRDDEVPLRCWEGDGTVMWIYCGGCSGFLRPGEDMA